MKIAIIEDEDLARDRLAKLIHDCDSSIEIIARIDSLKGALEFLQSAPEVDLIFMDIQLSDGISFDLFEKMEIPIPVIFITAYSEYTLKAFKVNTIDYLLKPVGAKELKAAIDKFRSINSKYVIAGKNYSKEFKEIIRKDYKTRFIVKAGLNLVPVPVENIICLYSKDGITFLISKDKKRFPIDYSLDQLESLLSPDMFFRVSRQYKINIHYIENIVSYSTSRLKVVLKDLKEEEIIVSREKVPGLKSWLDR